MNMNNKAAAVMGEGIAPRSSKRPAIVSDEHLRFLDALRESGATNMFGAGPYLVEQFNVTRSESHTILGYWMKSFGKETR